MKLRTYIIYAIGFIVLLSSCQKDNGNGVGDNPESSMEDLQVPPGFDYKTTKEVDLKVEMPDRIDFSQTTLKVEFYDALPQNGGNLIHKGSVSESGIYEASITVPRYLDSVIVSSAAGLGVIPLADSFKSMMVDTGFNYNSGYDTLPPQEPEEKSALLKRASHGGIHRHKNSQVVTNLISNGDFEVNDFGSIPYWSSPLVMEDRWLITDQLSGAAYQYNDNGNNILRIETNNFHYGGVLQFIEASPGDLITFSADLRSTGGVKRSWLFLIPRDANGDVVGWYYSSYLFNPGQAWTTQSVAANMPPNTAYCEILLWQHLYGSGSLDYDNVFVSGPIQDSDGDGVNDDEDDYPNDPNRAYNNYFPSGGYGSLAFEDLWPGKGDYDFNDLVTDYQFKTVTNADNNVVEIFADFGVRAIGAGLNNGFGFQIDSENIPSSALSVTGTDIQYDYIDLNSNGTEAGQNKPTIIVFDDAFNILQPPGGTLGVNTDPDALYVDPDTVNVLISFNEAIYSEEEVDIDNFNPFLIIDGERGKEVHLPDYKPTSLVDDSYFGTLGDDSQPGIDRYYKTENNLPWGLNIYHAFDYTRERSEIIRGHLHFAEWAQSDGVVFQDWYLNKENYRNADHIFSAGN